MQIEFFFLKCQLKTCNTILDKIFLNTMRRDLLNNVLILWAGIFTVAWTDYRFYCSKLWVFFPEALTRKSKTIAYMEHLL